MKINVQEELKRFKPVEITDKNGETQDLGLLLNYIITQLRDLKKADVKIANELHEIVPKLLNEIKTLLEKNSQTLNRLEELGNINKKKDDVLFAIYDRISNQLKINFVNQKTIQTEIYQHLLDYLESLFLTELEWIPSDSFGRLFNPFEHDGFAVENRTRYRTKDYKKMEIVNEIRTGFTCRGQILRKPVVEFYE